MADDQKKKRFALDTGRTSFTVSDLKPVRDQDNAKPVPAPPKIFNLDNPRLAPPGMSGTKTRTVATGRNQDININLNVNVRLEEPKPPQREKTAKPLPKERLRLGDEGKANREFRSIARSLPGHSRDQRYSSIKK